MVNVFHLHLVLSGTQLPLESVKIKPWVIFDIEWGKFRILERKRGSWKVEREREWEGEREPERGREGGEREEG